MAMHGMRGGAGGSPMATYVEDRKSADAKPIRAHSGAWHSLSRPTSSR